MFQWDAVYTSPNLGVFWQSSHVKLILCNWIVSVKTKNERCRPMGTPHEWMLMCHVSISYTNNTCKSQCNLAREKSLLSTRPISEKCKMHDVQEAFRVSRWEKMRQDASRQPRDQGTETEAISLATGRQCKKAYARHVLVSVASYLPICQCFQFENSWRYEL